MKDLNPLPILDGHNDTLLHLYLSERGGGRSFFIHSENGHIDLPRARQGGFAGGFFAIFSPDPTQAQPSREDLIITDNGYELPPFPAIDPAFAQQFTIAVAASLFRLEAESEGQIKVVRTIIELVQCLQLGILAIILHFEGAEAIDADLDALEVCSTRQGCALLALSGAGPMPLDTASLSNSLTHLIQGQV